MKEDEMGCHITAKEMKACKRILSLNQISRNDPFGRWSRRRKGQAH